MTSPSLRSDVQRLAAELPRTPLLLRGSMNRAGGLRRDPAQKDMRSLPCPEERAQLGVGLLVGQRPRCRFVFRRRDCIDLIVLVV